jgi:putative colanic acid biosynthesis acetyltransferase WcaF
MFIAPHVFIGPNVRVLGSPAFVRIEGGCSIGGVVFHAHAPITIGKNSIVNDGAELIAGTHDVNSSTFVLVAKPVSIGVGCWIATRSLILPGVAIGDLSVVGAGSVVTGSIPSKSIAVGNPARVVGERRLETIEYVPFNFHPASLMSLKKKSQAWKV